MISHPRSEYRQTADVIRRRIESGDYSRGHTLPREDLLAAELGVNRATVNRALRILAAEGLVQATRGKGTEVTRLSPIERAVPFRYSHQARHRDDGRGAFDAEVAARGMTPHSEVTVSRASPPGTVTAVFGADPGAAVAVVRSRRMYADDVPVQLADSYIPLDIAGGTALETGDTGPGGMLSRLADLGHAQVRMSERVTTRPPFPDEAEFLNLTGDHRVYAITHVGWDAAGLAVEVCMHVMPAHLWVLEYSWPVD